MFQMLGERVGSITIVERGVQTPVQNLNSQNKNRVLSHLFSKLPPPPHPHHIFCFNLEGQKQVYFCKVAEMHHLIGSGSLFSL
jgi:hypothetical protein